MGLQERRALKALEEEVFPKYQKQLEEVAGHPIPWTVDWNSLGGSLAAIGKVEEYALRSVVDAFRQICRDGLGRDAVKAGVKEIHFVNKPGQQEGKLSFADGVLRIESDLGDTVYSYLTDDFVRVVEAGL